jgi:hypothetical protein
MFDGVMSVSGLLLAWQRSDSMVTGLSFGLTANRGYEGPGEQLRLFHLAFPTHLGGATCTA